MKARTDKPLFLYGHSMGCLVTATFLLRNPGLKISGVIYAAPFFGFSPIAGVTPFRRAALHTLSQVADVSNTLDKFPLICFIL